MTTFSVCSLVRETSDVVQRFVDHYRRLGAETIFIYFDQDVPDADVEVPDFSGDSDVDLRLCTRAFWAGPQEQGVIGLDTKQMTTFHDAIRRNRSSWLLFCDADEFLTGTSALRETLERLPAEVKGIRIRNTEAVWATGDGSYDAFTCTHERRPFPRGLIGERLLPLLVYGRDRHELRRGTTGHREGKQMLRRGVVPETVNVHTAVVDGQGLRFLHDLLPEARDCRIVHFDALGYDRWVSKWSMRLNAVTRPVVTKLRRQQESRIGAAFRAGRTRRIFERYNTVNFWQRLVLARCNLLHRLAEDTVHGGPEMTDRRRADGGDHA